LQFNIYNFSTKGGSPSGGHFVMLYCELAFGEFVIQEEGKYLCMVVNVLNR